MTELQKIPEELRPTNSTDTKSNAVLLVAETEFNNSTNIKSNDVLVTAELVDPNDPKSYVFFCSAKHGEAPWGSNWFIKDFVSGPGPFESGILIPAGITFSSREKWMMYGKAILFDDAECAQRIMAENDPREIKKLGRLVKNFNEKTWNECAFLHVVNGVFLQFNQNPDLKKVLLGTEMRLFVEAADYDRIWGIGYKAETDAEAVFAIAHRHDWGQNLLGKALTKVREILRNQK